VESSAQSNRHGAVDALEPASKPKALRRFRGDLKSAALPIIFRFSQWKQQDFDAKLRPSLLESGVQF
jgi:hypothetical protein